MNILQSDISINYDKATTTRIHTYQVKMPTKKSTSSGSKKSGVVKAMSAQKNPTLEARARIPQTIGLPGQIANNAGGFSFPLPIEQEWMRYLIIG